MIPICWKCSAAITERDAVMGCSVLIGCKECADIKNYNDAKQHCPLLVSSVAQREGLEDE